MANKMIMTITISFPAKAKLEELSMNAGKSMSQFIEDLIVAALPLPENSSAIVQTVDVNDDPQLDRE